MVAGYKNLLLESTCLEHILMIFRRSKYVLTEVDKPDVYQSINKVFIYTPHL
jgi:hypothetical protein